MCPLCMGAATWLASGGSAASLTVLVGRVVRGRRARRAATAPREATEPAPPPDTLGSAGHRRVPEAVAPRGSRP